MARHVITPHPIGYAKSAAEAVVKQRKKSREEILKSPLTILKNTGRELIAERVWFHPIRGLGVVLMAPLNFTKLISDERRKVKMSQHSVTALMAAEMQRDPTSKPALNAVIDANKEKGKGTWLHVDKKGQIILTDHPGTRKGYLEYIMLDRGKLNKPDFKQAMLKSVPEFIDARAKSGVMYIGVRGHTLIVSKHAANAADLAREEKQKRAGIRNPRPAKSYDEVITRKEITSATLSPLRSGKSKMDLVLTDGGRRSFIVDNSKGKKILKQLKLM